MNNTTRYRSAGIFFFATSHSFILVARVGRRCGRDVSHLRPSSRSTSSWQQQFITARTKQPFRERGFTRKTRDWLESSSARHCPWTETSVGQSSGRTTRGERRTSRFENADCHASIVEPTWTLVRVTCTVTDTMSLLAVSTDVSPVITEVIISRMFWNLPAMFNWIRVVTRPPPITTNSSKTPNYGCTNWTEKRMFVFHPSLCDGRCSFLFL